MLVQLRLGPKPYRLLRPRLLDFCLRKGIAPERVAEVAHHPAVGWLREGVPLHRAITIDWPLRYVYRAYRLFWT
jgi:hypothetical protein